MMRFVYILLVLFGFLGSSTTLAADEVRAGCDSCRIQVKSLAQPLKLSGKWLFTRDDDIKNADVELDTSSWPVIKTPGPWKSAYSDGKNYRVGWYRGVFEFDESLVGQDVVILLNAYMGRVNVYNDGQEIYRRPGDINVERYYATQPIPIRFKVTQSKHVVAIRVDTLLMVGVYQLPFEMHKYDKHDTSLAWYQFQNGELRILSAFVVFSFGLFFLLVYRKTRYSLYLVAALTSISVFPFFVAPSDLLMKVLPPEPMLLLHYTGLIMFFSAYLFTQFFYKFTPKTNWVLGSIFTLLALTIAAQIYHFNLDLFQKVRGVFFLMSLLFGTLALYQAIRGALAKRFGAGALCVGLGIFYVAGVHDMLLSFGLINSMSTLFYGVLGFVLSMLYVASAIFANTFVENKRMAHDLKLMNDNLEHLVAERTLQLRQKTNDILTMLQNMPQGILTVTQGATIHPEYSAFLEQIFETKDIAGKGMMDVVFSKTNLGSDVLSQVEAVVDACIGEDKMNFEFNTHLMVTELDKTMPSGKVKSLEFSWSPICNEADVCEKLMLCVRDVTELKGLAAEASKQKRELEMIGQILSVNQEKFHQFIDSSDQFIEENRAIIESTDSRNMDAISHLFRNMHTIKGNARTYGLLQLTNTVHETEQAYDELRKNPEADWNKEQLLEQLKEAYVAIQEYARVNEVKLGRKGPGRRGGVDKFLMVQKDHIEALIANLEGVRDEDVAVKGDLLHRVLGTLKQIGTEKIDDVLAGVIDSLPSLAKELGKEPPIVQIDDGHIVVRNQIADLLKNVFMHLLRNSIDHGIETAVLRIGQGKNPAGTIRLVLSLGDGKLWFRLQDDGKGLPMAFIRQKAIQSGLIQENESVSPEGLAQMIFASGFSTASVVTEVSGRGVGMDAVKGFVEREGGTIELRFLNDDPDSEFRQFETVIALPDGFAVRLNN
jgi:HPt (histidine-containing phosphotransfer) domain-containing protein